MTRPAFSVVLRDYQLDAVGAVEKAAADGACRALVVLPTGTGKTQVFCEIIRRRGGRALVVAHREELLDQATARLVGAGIDPADVGRVRSGADETGAAVVVASVQTLVRETRRRRLLDSSAVAGPFMTVVVDEAHHAPATSYRRLLDDLDTLPVAPFVVGVTATPGRQGLREVFGRPVFTRDLLDMIAGGWLCDLRGRRVRLSIDLSAVRRTGGDYVEADLARALAEAGAPVTVAAAVAEHAEDRPCLVFTAGVKAAHETAAALVARGISAEALDGTARNDHRVAVLDRFRSGETQALVNCSLFAEGIDLPHVSCIVVARPTLSPILYAQMIGRGTRVAPGKSDCLVIDLVGATDVHDLGKLGTTNGARATRPRQFADLAGMKVKDGGTILQAAAADTRRRERLEALYGEHGSVLAEDVALFGITRFRWLPLSGDRTRYALSLGDTGYALITPARDDHDLWHIHRVADQGLFAVSETPVSLTDAMRTAEKLARGAGATALASAAAPWRKRQSPSDKQLALLGRLTQTDTAAARKLTAGQVSDLIDAAKVTRLLRRHRIVQRVPA